jgi:hypothetical protein
MDGARRLCRRRMASRRASGRRARGEHRPGRRVRGLRGKHREKSRVRTCEVGNDLAGGGLSFSGFGTSTTTSLGHSSARGADETVVVRRRSIVVEN